LQARLSTVAGEIKTYEKQIERLEQEVQELKAELDVNQVSVLSMEVLIIFFSEKSSLYMKLLWPNFWG
jgi:phage shock protein A